MPLFDVTVSCFFTRVIQAKSPEEAEEKMNEHFKEMYEFSDSATQRYESAQVTDVEEIDFEEDE